MRTTMQDISLRLQKIEKGQEDTQHLIGEFVATATNLQKIVTSHETILKGDDVQPGIYKQTIEHAKYIEELKVNNVIDNTLEFSKLKLWMQGAIAVGGINILWQIFTYFVPNIQVHLGFIFFEQLVRHVFASN